MKKMVRSAMRMLYLITRNSEQLYNSPHMRMMVTATFTQHFLRSRTCTKPWVVPSWYVPQSMFMNFTQKTFRLEEVLNNSSQNSNSIHRLYTVKRDIILRGCLKTYLLVFFTVHKIHNISRFWLVSQTLFLWK